MASGTITGTVTNRSAYFSYYIVWSAVSNVSGNYSDVTATSYWRTNNTSYTWDTVGNRDTYIEINGSRAAVSKRFNCNPWPSGGVYQVQTYTARVNHDSNGTKTIAISAYANGYANTYGPGVSQASGSCQLDTIPRASTVTATDANIEAATTITINKASSGFMHSLSWGVGASAPSTWTQIVSQTTAGSYGWTIPASIYALCPNSQTYKYVWIKCDTYNGSTLLGSNTCKLTATATAAECGPQVSATWSTNNTTALTGSSNTIIRYYSTVTASMTAQARESATLTDKKMTCTDGQTKSITTSQSISQPGAATFAVTVTDSRGFTASATKTYGIVNYIIPTVSAVATRPAPTTGEVNLEVSGVCFNGSFGAQTNTLTVQYRYKQASATTWSSWVNLAATKTGNTYTAYATLAQTFDYQSAWDFEVKAADRISTITSTASVGKGVPVFDWGENDFNFNVPVNFTQGARNGSLCDIIYPVGSIYMSITATSPATLFGGTWTQIKDKFLLSAGTSYAAGTTGGEATHTLSVYEIAAHNHVAVRGYSGSVSDYYGGSAAGYGLVPGASSGNVNSDGMTNYAGGNQPHNNMPPYVAVYVWQRTE